jgi:hypothetical protein
VPLAVLAALLILSSRSTLAEEYSVASLKAPPPDGLSQTIADRLAPAALKIKRGTREMADIWLARQWPIKPGFEASGTVLYPFKVGELVGAVRFNRKASDFRGKEIAKGVYTLRYGQQPVDGNHVGTSATRDFLLLLPAAADTSPEPIEEKTLLKQSAKAVKASHPAILTLLKPETKAASLPALRHDEDQEWWILQFAGQGKADGQAKEIVLELVVVGKAAE